MWTEQTVKDGLELYENGKHRRYNLLFAVNGGAFAIAKLMVGEPGEAGVVLGGLTLRALCIGMVLFTAVMVDDIYTFGEKMRTELAPEGAKVFAKEGKRVLILLGLLVCAGWLLVGFGAGARG